MTGPLSIQVDKVRVTYRNGHTAINEASFMLHGGTICALVGVNGGGKSTLFKCIMGIVKPSVGQVSINQQTVKQALRANQVAYVPQNEEIDWNFPVLVRDVVMMGRYGKMNFLRRPKQIDNQLVDQALARVGLTDLQHRQIGELSGGQKKRVFLARALTQQAQILLLDEPFTGVDIQTENTIIDLLRQLREEGQLIVVSTHNLGSVPDYCDQTILINRTVVAQGPTASTFTQHNLELTFGGILRHINLPSEALHHDEDPRAVTVVTDDERAVVFYGKDKHQAPHRRKQSTKRSG